MTKLPWPGETFVFASDSTIVNIWLNEKRNLEYKIFTWNYVIHRRGNKIDWKDNGKMNDETDTGLE